MSLEKHRNPNGTYDGPGVMSEITGLGRDEVLAIAEQVKANNAKLNACPWHEFEEEQTTEAHKQRYRCRHCGGTVDAVAYRWHERGRRPGKVNPNPPELAITWHDSPESVHRAMWEEAAIAEGMTYEQLMAESEGEGETEDGEQVVFTHEQELAGMHEQGCWAFVDTRVNMIHAWADPEAPFERVLHMLAHEVGHATGDSHPDDLQEEMRAEQFGRVAKAAYAMLPAREPEVWRMFDGENGYEYSDDPETIERWRAYLGDTHANFLTPLYK